MPKAAPTKGAEKAGSAQQTLVFHISWRWTKCEDIDDDLFENIDHIKESLRDAGADRFIFQRECPEGTTNVHYQGYLHLKEKKRPKALAIELNETLFGVNCQAAATRGVQALKKYAMKTDTRIAGPWADRKVYMGADLPTKDSLYGWQKEIIAWIEEPWNDRKIYWIRDVDGNSGKTKLAKYCAFHYGSAYLGYGQAKDILSLATDQRDADAFFVDLTRTRPKSSDASELYSSVESVKNGFWQNQKYETDTIMCDPPHVVVFANELPFYSALSKDRWQVYDLKNAALTRIE